MRSSNRQAVVDERRDGAVLDPVEIEEMRACNPLLTPELFLELHKELAAEHPGGATYPRFLRRAAAKFREANPDPADKIELGHYLDRVVLSLPGYSDSTTYPLPLLFAVLSLALYSTVERRLDCLHAVLSPSPGGPVPAAAVEAYLQTLLDTCQLPPEAQALEEGPAWPVQQYAPATGGGLLRAVRGGEGDEEKRAHDRAMYGAEGEEVTREVFGRILRARPVCAWGECYRFIQKEE
jgi:hypothetical protein